MTTTQFYTAHKLYEQKERELAKRPWWSYAEARSGKRLGRALRTLTSALVPRPRPIGKLLQR